MSTPSLVPRVAWRSLALSFTVVSLPGCVGDGSGSTDGGLTEATTRPDPSSTSTSTTEPAETGTPTTSTTSATETPGSTTEDLSTGEPPGESSTTGSAETGGSTGAASAGSTSSGESASSTGAGGECVPGDTASCYGGPPGTAGVGACKAGLRTCGGDGAFGPCEGEVLPAVETCAARADVDCDGATTACTGAGLWAKAFGENYNQLGWEIASDAGGRIAVAGRMSGSIDFGDELLTPGGKAGAFLGLLDPDGGPVWSHAFGFSASNAWVSDVLAQPVRDKPSVWYKPAGGKDARP